MLTTLRRHWKNALFILFSIVVLSGVFGASSVQAATCAISADTVIDQSYVTSNSCTSININASVSTTWIGTVDLGGGTVTVKAGNTMTMGTSSVMMLGSNDDFVIESGATTTHNAEDPSGVRITARNISIYGSLDVSNKGCRGTGDTSGYGPSLTTFICTSATSGAGGHAAGGSYGGRGGDGYAAARTTYGSATGTLYLGSGGGGPAFTGTRGGYGAGLVYLYASGTLTVNGSIVANGEDGVGGNTGAGSGGSIRITANVLAGTGYIRANGGAGSGFGGYGGGGRVAVYYNSSTFDLSTILARDGSNTDTSRNGTVFILDRTTDDGSGNVRINSGFDFPSGFDAQRLTFYATTGTRLGCAAQTTIAISASATTLSGTYWSCASTVTNIYVTGTTSLEATNAAWLFTDVSNVVLDGQSSIELSGVTTTLVKSGATMSIYSPATLTLTNVSLTGPSNAGTSSANGGRLFLTPGLNLSLVNTNIKVSTVSSTFAVLSIDATSSINVSGRGCQGTSAATGYGPHSSTGVCTSGQSGSGNQAAGGGHGGAGGNGYSTGGVTYGSSTNPVLLGSSGGGIAFFGTRGGNGGGLLRLDITGNLTLNGSIWANGENGVDGYTGGGSGGSIYIRADAIIGNGTVQAKGGTSGPSNGGGGGGGRIALIYSSLTTFSTSANTAYGGGSGVTNSGSTGTIYTFVTNQAPSDPSSLGPTALVNGSTTGTNTPEFTFTLSDPDLSDTVRYRIQIDDSSDFSSPVVDYTSALQSQGTASFTVGQVEGSGAYTVGSAGQTLSNGSYYWRVKAADAATVESSYSTANSGSVAFIVDVTTRYIGFAQTAESALESVTATSIRITLSQTHFEDVSVAYSVTGGTATGGGQDYTLTSGTATILAGDTSTTIALVVVDDQIDEPDETIEITLSSPTFATIGSNTTTTYTITDNDVASVTLTESGGSTAVTEGGATDSFTIVLDTQPESTVSISFATSSLGVSLSTSTIAFTSSDWNTPVTVTVTAYDDQVAESTHAATITRSISTSAYGYSVMSDQDTSVIITDNDTAGVSISTSSLSLAEGGASSTYTVVLQSAPTTTVTVTLSNSANDVLYTPTTLSFTSSNWATPQTVTVGAVDDTDYESTHTDTISHVASSAGHGYTAALSIQTVTATITDNESSDIQLSASSFSGTEGEVKAYTIVLSSSPASDVVITLNPQSRFVSVSPSTLTFTSGNWNAPQTVSITLVNNSDYEGARTTGVTQAVASSAPGFSGVTLPTIEVIITDDDNPGGGATAASTALPPPITVITLPPPVTSVDAGSEPTSSNAPDAIPNQPGQLPATTPPAAVLTGVSQSAKAFGVTLPQVLQQEVAIFIDQGTNNPRVEQLGSGERKAVFHDALDTMKDKLNIADLERIAIGEIPVNRNLAQERLQVPRALTTFKTIYGHAPNFKNDKENLAWNTLMYRLRFERNLTQERQGIQQFQRMFGRAPKDPFQWSTVRVLGYIR